MTGREKAVERELELATFTAWQIARMTTYGEKRLKPFAEWLKDLRPRTPARQQSVEEMVAALRVIRETMSGGEVSDAR